jgi:hypothetical protein
VAIGDSFTEGLGDTLPDGSQRGWADLVAAGLAAAEKQTIQYANLAIRGRLLEPIVTEQLEAALSLDPLPTLLSLNGGGNDMMRPGSDMSQLVALTERALRRCAEAGVRVLLLSGADPSGNVSPRPSVKLSPIATYRVTGGSLPARVLAFAFVLAHASLSRACVSFFRSRSRARLPNGTVREGRVVTDVARWREPRGVARPDRQLDAVPGGL